MSIEDYESLRRSRPEFKLPAYQNLTRSARKRLKKIPTRQWLIGRAASFVMIHGPDLEYTPQRYRNFVKETKRQ